MLDLVHYRYIQYQYRYRYITLKYRWKIYQIFKRYI
jgi:hypothetical protein